MSSTADLDFLKGYAGAGGVVQIQNAQGQYITVQPAPVTKPLQPITAAGGGGASPTISNAPTQTAQQPPAGATPAQQRAAQQQQAQQQRQQAASRKRGQQTATRAGMGVLGAAQDGIEKVTSPLQRVSAWAETVPTPGGLGAMFLGLVVLVSAVVPVNQGYTRLQLAWLTILGRTHIPESEQATADRTSGKGDGSKQSLLDQLGQDLKNIKLPGGIGPGGIASGTGTGSGNPIGGAPPSTGGSRFVAPSSYGQLPIAPPLPSSGFRPRGYGGNGS